MHNQPVWITGIGAATPLGSNFVTFSENLLSGRSATRVLTDQNGATDFRTTGSSIASIPVPAGWDEADFRQLPKIEQVALSCCSAAIAEAGWLHESPSLRIGIVLGVGGEWLHHWEMNAVAGGTNLYQGSESDSLLSLTQHRLGIAGPRATVGAACASGNYALAQARRWIRLGLVDVCLAGGLEVTTPICRAAFNNLRAMSRRVDDAEHASRPFDRDRDGFVMGEGGAVFALESAERARRRGARAYAEVAGFGSTSDAFHMIIPSSDPASAAGAMNHALSDAAVAPQDIDYINAHATSTPVGDKAEARAIHSVFGPHAATTHVSSTKSMTGHLLSAAAAVEVLACLAAFDRQTVPPTINLENPDPECDLCHVPNQALEKPITLALSNSFGFGGSNTSVVLRQVA